MCGQLPKARRRKKNTTAKTQCWHKEIPKNKKDGCESKPFTPVVHIKIDGFFIDLHPSKSHLIAGGDPCGRPRLDPLRMRINRTIQQKRGSAGAPQIAAAAVRSSGWRIEKQQKWWVKSLETLWVWASFFFSLLQQKLMMSGPTLW